jgi:hypothetical protein
MDRLVNLAKQGLALSVRRTLHLHSGMLEASREPPERIASMPVSLICPHVDWPIPIPDVRWHHRPRVGVA